MWTGIALLVLTAIGLLAITYFSLQIETGGRARQLADGFATGHPETRILFMSGYAGEALSAEASAEGPRSAGRSAPG